MHKLIFMWLFISFMARIINAEELSRERRNLFTDLASVLNLFPTIIQNLLSGIGEGLDSIAHLLLDVIAGITGGVTNTCLGGIAAEIADLPSLLTTSLDLCSSGSFSNIVTGIPNAVGLIEASLSGFKTLENCIPDLAACALTLLSILKNIISIPVVLIGGIIRVIGTIAINLGEVLTCVPSLLVGLNFLVLGFVKRALECVGGGCPEVAPIQ